MRSVRPDEVIAQRTALPEQIIEKTANPRFVKLKLAFWAAFSKVTERVLSRWEVAPGPYRGIVI